MADKKADQFYTRPPKLGKWESFKIFLWNSETNQFLGRTGASWGKIILFYIIFYVALVGFFAAMLAVFYQTLHDTEPKWKLDSSLIGSNPGLGFRPMPPDANVESTLIWYRSDDKENVKHWVEQLDKFLEPYNNKQNMENVDPCEHTNKPEAGRVCEFKIGDWYPCSQADSYGFQISNKETGPCIFLKLNKIYDWVPEYYNSTNLPSSMPEHLKETIKDKEKMNEHNIVWVDCAGENPADVENIGPINYHPIRGFHQKYFPFKNIKGYLSPLVVVHFEKPKKGVLINIECKAWAKNIHHDRVERRGSVHFELMMD